MYRWNLQRLLSRAEISSTLQKDNHSSYTKAEHTLTNTTKKVLFLINHYTAEWILCISDNWYFFASLTADCRLLPDTPGDSPLSADIWIFCWADSRASDYKYLNVHLRRLADAVYPERDCRWPREQNEASFRWWRTWSISFARMLYGR